MLIKSITHFSIVTGMSENYQTANVHREDGSSIKNEHSGIGMLILQLGVAVALPADGYRFMIRTGCGFAM